MISFIINLLISGFIVFVLAKILPGVSISGYGAAVGLAIVLGLLNAFIRPVLSFLSFPITFLTLGLFSFVITAVIVLIASAIMGNSFHVEGFWYALLFGVVLGLFQSFFGSFWD